MNLMGKLYSHLTTKKNSKRDDSSEKIIMIF